MNISVIQSGSRFYTVTSYDFVDGILDIDDTIQAGNNCYGVVLSTKPDGKSVIINAFGNCSYTAGDSIGILQDTSILESFSRNLEGATHLEKMTLSSDKSIENNAGIYKIQVRFMENTKSTSCIAYGAPASTLQAELDHLFDFDGNGVIDVYDKGHISVRREGDGTARWSFRYEYIFKSMGSSLRLGSSSVLGSNASQLHSLGIGISLQYSPKVNYRRLFLLCSMALYIKSQCFRLALFSISSRSFGNDFFLFYNNCYALIYFL